MTSMTASQPKVAVTPKRKFSSNLNYLQTIQIAWRAIIANTTRSILTALGVIIGVAAQRCCRKTDTLPSRAKFQSPRNALPIRSKNPG
jgi:hypothetical protein